MVLDSIKYCKGIREPGGVYGQNDDLPDSGISNFSFFLLSSTFISVILNLNVGIIIHSLWWVEAFKSKKRFFSEVRRSTQNQTPNNHSEFLL